MKKVNGPMDNKHLPEGYIKHLQENKKFIEELAREELLEKRDSVGGLRNKIILEKKQTDVQKERFINEIRGGLGEIVKKHPNDITFIKKPWHHKFTTVIKKILSRI